MTHSSAFFCLPRNLHLHTYISKCSCHSKNSLLRRRHSSECAPSATSLTSSASLSLSVLFHSLWTMRSDSSSYHRPPLDAMHPLYIDKNT
ncbi:hypothetical protein BC943DRAFT_377273 [Umbelopsis sp. AD052]|nr:hypothetical protein BC943DRAFT_377273 [Umbelopsis sp. AD052]